MKKTIFLAQKTPLLVAVFAALVAGQAPVQAATTVTFQEGVGGYAGTQDTGLRQANSDRVDGALGSVKVDGQDGGGPVHGLIRFDNIFGSGANQIPKAAAILSANLTIRITNLGDDIKMHRMLIPWDQKTDNWDTKIEGIDANDVEAAATEDLTFPPRGSVPFVLVIPLDVKTLQAWSDGTKPNYGWAMIPTGSDGVDFDSSENGTAANRPILTVVWGVAGEPFVDAFSSSPGGFEIQIKDGTPPGAVNAASVAVTFDGSKVTPQVKKAGTTTTVTYTSPTLLAAGSIHTVTLGFADSGTSPKTQTAEKTFKVGSYALLTVADKVTPDTSKPGFIWRVSQNNDAGQGNTTARTENQLAGLIKDANGDTIPNNADPNAVGGADGPAKAPNPAWAPIEFQVSKVINFNQNDGGNNGSFTPDLAMPGIPGVDGSADSYAAEIITYLELPAGLITMGINSDDGFRTSVGAIGDLADVFTPPAVAGEFNGGRGSGDTIFQIGVNEPGVYAFRTTYEEGGGDSNIEWFTVKPDGTKVLVNDTVNGGVKAYRAILPGAKKAVGRKVSPAPNSGGAAYDTQILAEIVDGGSPIATSTVSLKFDGAAVAANVARAGTVTTVTFKPAALLAPKSTHTVELTFTDGGKVVTRQWKFITLNTDLLAYWDFNDASDPAKAKDKVGGFVGALVSGAKYTDDGKGRSGKAGDRAARTGSASPLVEGYINVTDANVAFMNAGGIQNQLAVSLWQRLDETKNSSGFWAIGEGQDRAFQAHIPWGDKTIYFDTGGGCCDGTQRINKNIADLAGANPDDFFLSWHHFVFQKDRDQKQIWIDGKLYHEGVNNSPLPFVFTQLWIGSQAGAANPIHGDIDEFAVFATALTPSEIAKLASGTAPDQVRPITVTPTAAKFTKFIRNADGTLTVEWTGGGTLQAAVAVTGPWQDIPGAASPYSFKPPAAVFFGRIKN